MYELVIESNKKAASNPTIENRESYEKILEKFNQKYHDSNKSLQNLWKHAQEESKKQLVALKEKIKKGKDIKVRIDNLERVESAKIYYIIKGLNPDGTEWGRIDFVGANYIPIHENKVPKGFENNLPLVVKYYIYEDGKYKFQKSSNNLESSFDKQLMDIFQKSGRISYEQHSNLGRDYEYSPGLALLYGRGPWYVNLGSMATLGGEEKAIEVPDWNDFGFEDLYDEYLDKCGKQQLTSSGASILKKKMTTAIEQQKQLIEDLKKFHTQENDNDKNTAILVGVWGKRVGEFDESMKELKENCITIQPTPTPCTKFTPIFKKHKDLCDENKLTKKEGDLLKQQMQDCIDTGEDRVVQLQKNIESYKKIPDWDKDKKIKEEVERLEQEANDQEKTNQEQKTKLSSLDERCIPPITRPIPVMPPIDFVPDGFTKRSGYSLAAEEVAKWLIENPFHDVKIISDAQGGKTLNKDAEWDKKIPKTTKGLTYKNRLSQLLTAYRDDIIAASKGLIEKDRIKTFYGNVKDTKIKTIALPK